MLGNEKVPLSVIILTYNEELNIRNCLESLKDWTTEVLMVDSLSTDKTVDIARHYPCRIIQNKFEGYSQQRNWALEHLQIETEWIFFLDADEWVPEELKYEIGKIISNNPIEDGFYIKRRFIWMGKWIKRGYYPTWILRLFRHGKGFCENRSVNEHIIVKGKIGYLKNDFIHEDLKGITEWVARQSRFASLEAQELFREGGKSKHIETKLFGAQAEQKRWLRYNIWNKLPPLIRPFIYFTYRYFLKGGFLDGKEAFIYHFLQGLWLPFLIDVKYLEKKMKQTKA